MHTNKIRSDENRWNIFFGLSEDRAYNKIQIFVNNMPVEIDDNFVQINRIMINKRKRGLGLYKKLLDEAYNWVYNNLGYSNYFSIYGKDLSNLYKRVMKRTEFGQEFIVPQKK